jgi:hypothetical protein
VRLRIFGTMKWWYAAHLDERALALKLPGTDPVDGYPTISFASKLFRNELVEALPQEGGALTAYQHTQYMADMFLLPGPHQMPAPAPAPAATGTPSDPYYSGGGPP